VKIGWFSTGKDQAAIDLLKTVQKAIKQGEIKAEIEFVFSNREIGESKATNQFLTFVNHDERLPFETLSSSKFKSSLRVKNIKKWRRKYDLEVIRRLKMFLPVDLIVLAGYMLVVSEEICQRYKMINLHPAAPDGPKGTWQEIIWQLIENRAEESGVMMHLVTPELDAGPPVTYCTFPIKDDSNQALWEAIEKSRKDAKLNLFREIRRRGLQREFSLIVTTLRAFSEGKVGINLKKRRVIDSQGFPIPGYNLTEEVERNLKGGENGSKK
jgi:phosphoribosylglycinamide formyltransferase-1